MTEDPFAHLHDEDYAAAFAAPLATQAGAVAMAGRARISLAGTWSFTPDLFDEGLRQRWFADPRIEPSQWARPRDWDPDGAENLEVPGCWTMAKPEWRFFEGAAWYQRDFDWHPGRAPRLVLRIGGALSEARVFLNGEFLARHLGGSTPFYVELTSKLRPGSNDLLIQVDNRRRPDRVPMHHFDWFNHGGLFREVDLVPLPAVFMREAIIGLASDAEGGGIAVAIRLSDPVNTEARITLPGLGLQAFCEVRAGTGRVVIPGDPPLWSPEHPVLHELTVEAAGDRVVDRVGFRRVTTEGTRILLNGTRVWLRGVCVHEDDRTLGRTTTEADIRRRFADARALGCNFLRLAHYPHHERVAEIADEEGLMLWAEIPVYWAIDFANPATYADAQNQLRELIARDHNRASVIIWGVGNENADTDARYHFMAALVEVSRTADPSRLVAAACLINREHFRIEDRLAEHLDIIGINEYFGWYEPDISGLEHLLTNSNPQKPVVISETGADALAGYHGGERELFTEECQAAIYREQLAIIARHEFVQGYCPWILYDYRSERRQTRFQRGFNRKGLIAEDKITRKKAFHVIARSYGALATNDGTLKSPSAR
jgi:beta-glucuronidase